MGMARIEVGDAYLRVVYSRPYARGRETIFGTEESEALVPFGKLWRTGANEATEITVPRNVVIAGQTLPAGMGNIGLRPVQRQDQPGVTRYPAQGQAHRHPSGDPQYG